MPGHAAPSQNSPSRVLPDHATPCATKTHTSEPVPYLLVGEGIEPDPHPYTEAGTAGLPSVPGHGLVAALIGA